MGLSLRLRTIMDRRRFLCLPVAAALLPTRANAGAADGKRRLAFFSWRSTCGPDSLQESILPALRAAGWTEGHNLSIERHCAFADNDAAPALANALARSGADVAVVWGAFSVGPLRRATTSIPI